MINSFKPYKISEHDITNLKNVTPYWDKQVSKNIKSLMKWLIKFNKNVSDFEIKYTNNFNEYIFLFQEIDNYTNFYNQNSKLINANSKLLLKFHKLIIDYVRLLGWTKSIELICEFYSAIEKNDIGKKQEFALKILNDCLIKYFEIFKKEIAVLIPEDEYIELLYEKVFVRKETVVRSDLIVKKIMSYSKMLKKKNKIDELSWVKTNVRCIEVIVFSNSIIDFYSRFLSNVY